MTRPAAVLLVLCAQHLSGCSLLFTQRPALPPDPPSERVRCSESRAAPIADTVLASALVAAGAALIVHAVTTPEDPDAVDCTSCFAFALSAIPLGYGAMAGITAGVGYRRVESCRRVHAWQARCLGGDAAACAALQGEDGPPPDGEPARAQVPR